MASSCLNSFTALFSLIVLGRPEISGQSENWKKIFQIDFVDDRYKNSNSLPVREVSPAFSYWCRSFVNSQPFHHMRSHYLYWCEFDVNIRCLILIWRILSASILIVGTSSRPQNANYDLSRGTILRWNQFQTFFLNVVSQYFILLQA